MLSKFGHAAKPVPSIAVTPLLIYTLSIDALQLSHGTVPRLPDEPVPEITSTPFSAYQNKLSPHLPYCVQSIGARQRSHSPSPSLSLWAVSGTVCAAVVTSPQTVQVYAAVRPVSRQVASFAGLLIAGLCPVADRVTPYSSVTPHQVQTVSPE